MSYEFLPEIAIADQAFRASGKTLEEVFVSAGDAVTNTMIDGLGAIEPKKRRSLHLENAALDLLLFDFLQEIIYLKDSEQLLLRLERAQIREIHGKHVFDGELAGEKLDPARHSQRDDVKAVTLHRFNLEKTAAGWSATVILDI